MGYWVRDEETGTPVGMILVYPWLLRYQGVRLNGASAGTLFVQTEAKMQGFYLFRRFLAMKGVQIFFSNTCNAVAGALWARSGAAPVPDTEHELLLPLRPSAFVEELAERRFGRRWVSRLAGALTQPAGWLLPGKLPRNRLRFTLCSDWEKLSALADRVLADDLLQTDRTPAYLRWIYDPAAAADDGPWVFIVQNSNGTELGWVSVQPEIRGYRQQIRGLVLADVVAHRGTLGVAEIYSGILEQLERRWDALRVRGRLITPMTPPAPGFRLRTFGGPTSYVIRKGEESVVAANQMLSAPADAV
jgi:hypothetical protein